MAASSVVNCYIKVGTWHTEKLPQRRFSQHWKARHRQHKTLGTQVPQATVGPVTHTPTPVWIKLISDFAITNPRVLPAQPAVLPDFSHTWILHRILVFPTAPCRLLELKSVDLRLKLRVWMS